MDCLRVCDSSLNSDFQLNNIETDGVPQIEPSREQAIELMESEITGKQGLFLYNNEVRLFFAISIIIITETPKNTPIIHCPIDDITTCVSKELPVPNHPFPVLDTQITEKEGRFFYVTIPLLIYCSNLKNSIF